MNIDLKMFIEFPGILITIGIVLLIISIITIIIIYKSESKVIDASVLNENSYQNYLNNEIYQEEPINTPQVQNINESVAPEPVIKQNEPVTKQLEAQLSTLTNEGVTNSINVPTENKVEPVKYEEPAQEEEESGFMNVFEEEFKEQEETTKEPEKQKINEIKDNQNDEDEIELL